MPQVSEPMPIFIQKFWTEYKPDPKDPTKLREVDWVAYSPLGSLQKTVNTEAVWRLAAVIPMEGRAEINPAVQMAHMRWNAIRPHYEAWKQGRETPLEGHPLAAWPGISQEQAELFRMKGVRTVEEVAALTDTHRQTMGVPGLHDIISNAKRFLQAQDKGAVINAFAERDAKISEQNEQIKELAEIVQELRKELNKDNPPKRPRGRPRKQPAEQPSV